MKKKKKKKKIVELFVQKNEVMRRGLEQVEFQLWEILKNNGFQKMII